MASRIPLSESQISGAIEGLHGRLRETREKRNITQKQLAEAIGAHSQAAVSAWENGGQPNLYYLFALCDHLDVSADWLLGLQPNTFAGGGIEWAVSVPDEKSTYYDEELKTGAERFNEIVTGSVSQELKGLMVGEPVVIRHLLRRLFVTGTVRIIKVAEDPVRAERVQNEFSLNRCIVADLDQIPSYRTIDSPIRNEAVAFLAAQDAKQSLQAIESCGIVGGSVISRWVDLLPAKFGKVKWVSMIKTAGVDAPFGNTANALVARLTYTQGGTGLRMPYIDPRRRSKEYRTQAIGADWAELQDAKRVQLAAQNVDTVFMSVGSSDNYVVQPNHPLGTIWADMEREDRHNVVGDVLLRLIGRDGEQAGTLDQQLENDETVCSIGLDALRDIAERANVWILAGQSSKAGCIRAALTARLANSLVIDSSVADTLMHKQS